MGGVAREESPGSATRHTRTSTNVEEWFRMTYRFVLEVPTSIGDDARAVIDQAPEAEVMFTRAADRVEGGGGRTAITVVAHSFAVIDALYRWLEEHPEAGEATLAALGGRPVRLASVEPEQMKAQLQGDQTTMAISAGSASQPQAVEPARGAGAAAASLQPYGLNVATDEPLIRAERSLVIEAVDHIAIRVANIRRAETFYHEFFQMDVVLRARRTDDGWEKLPADYDWEAGLRQGVYVDMVYLQHPPLSLVLLGAGRGAIFQEPRLDHISLRLSPGSLMTIRAQALVRSFSTIRDEPHSFMFRDPFGITWHLTDGAAG